MFSQRVKKSKWLKSAQVISGADSKTTQAGFNLFSIFFLSNSKNSNVAKWGRGPGVRAFLKELDCDGEFGSGPVFWRQYSTINNLLVVSICPRSGGRSAFIYLKGNKFVKADFNVWYKHRFRNVISLTLGTILESNGGRNVWQNIFVKGQGNDL